LRSLRVRRDLRSTAAWQRCLVFIGVSLAVVACGGEPTTIAEPSPTVLVPPNGAASEPILASESGPTIFFPKQKPVEGERVVMEAELIGELAVIEGCLRVTSSSGSDTDYLLVWPPGFRLSAASDGTHVLNGAGQVVARAGEEVYMGGGEYRYVEQLDEYVRRQLPPGCPGPYWIVGDVVSSTKTTETPGPTIFFPKQKPVEGEREVMTAELFGELAVLEGCLRVTSFSGSNTDYLLVWPPDFRLSTEGDGIQVLNGDGQVAARVGEEVFIGGGKIGYVHRLDEYVRQQLPPGCAGPYWIVGDVVSSAKSLQVFGSKIYLILQPPTVGERVNMLAGGNIELVLDEGRLRIGSADGDLIIWPPGFSLTTEDDGVQILNEAGKIVAHVGEKVRMGGGHVSSLRHTGDYVLRNLPPSCPGPYWVVGNVPTGPPRDNPYQLTTE